MSSPIERTAEEEVARAAAQVAERELQNRASDLVRVEVYACVSSLVSDLARGYGEALPDGLSDLAEEAYELCNAVPDYEEAANQEGIEVEETEDGWRYSTNASRLAADDWKPDEDETEADRPDRYEPLSADDEGAAYREACEAERVDPYEREIYEHWIISGWLRRKLEARGEKCGELAGLIVWGRPTTGQAISMDGVIRDIVRELHKPEPVEPAKVPS